MPISWAKQSGSSWGKRNPAKSPVNLSDPLPSDVNAKEVARREAQAKQLREQKAMAKKSREEDVKSATQEAARQAGIKRSQAGKKNIESASSSSGPKKVVKNPYAQLSLSKKKRMETTMRALGRK